MSVGSARPSLRMFPAILLLLFGAAPVAAQQPDQKVGGQAFRTSLGATLLMPMSGDAMATDPDRLPSGRAVLEIQANPVFGFHFGAMRLAPNMLWSEGIGAGSDDPQSRLALTAGILGFRLNITTGRIRIAPFVDGGFGQFQGLVDQGGYFYVPQGDDGYQPAFVDTTGFMAGGGGGLALDAIIGPGLTLGLIGGYWHFMEVLGETTEEPLIEPMSGLWAGAGVKLAFKSESYYWRHSGRDGEPPVIIVMDPTPKEGNVIDVGGPVTTLMLQVADISDVDSVFVNGARLRTIPMTGTGRDRGVTASAPLQLHPGSNQISYAAYDGAGNVNRGTWEVLGVPLDKEGPVVTVLQPAPDVSITSDKVLVEAIIRDRSPIRQVTMNALGVNTVEASAAEREQVGATADDFVVKFSSTTNVPSAQFDIAIAAVDSASNQVIETVTVRRAGMAVAQAPTAAAAAAAGPSIEIHTPAEWAGGGTRGFSAQPKTSIRVSGLARYQEGVKEVKANGRRLSIQRDPNNPSVAQFTGFIEPPTDGASEVEILAVGVDGRQTVRTFETQLAAAPEAAAGPMQFENVANARNRKRWAVVIGVSDYIDPTISDLAYADDDALAVYDFLRSPSAGMGGIPEENIRLLVNEQATSRNIRSALTTFLRGSTPDDVVFIYIAGHGAPDPYRLEDLYILAHDTEIQDIAATGVSMALVNDAIQQAYAYNKILITDACHSAGVGAAGTRSVNTNMVNAAFLEYMSNSTGGFVAFTASEANQLSQEGERFGGGHGVFTHYLLEGLKGAADDDGDRVVTLGEVMEFTRDRVRRETRNSQIPTISLTSYDRFWPMAAVLEDPTPEAGTRD